MLSSGKHSLTGGRRISKSATPSRSPLTGGEHQLPLRFASPEQARDGDPYLRRTLVRRRTACIRMLSSDKHSLTGGRRIPKSATPSRRALTGGEHQLPLKFASPEQARDGGCVPPTSPRSSEDSLRLHAQLRQTFPHRRKMNTEARNSVEKPAHRRSAPAPVKLCFAGAEKDR